MKGGWAALLPTSENSKSLLSFTSPSLKPSREWASSTSSPIRKAPPLVGKQVFPFHWKTEMPLGHYMCSYLGPQAPTAPKPLFLSTPYARPRENPHPLHAHEQGGNNTVTLNLTPASLRDISFSWCFLPTSVLAPKTALEEETGETIHGAESGRCLFQPRRKTSPSIPFFPPSWLSFAGLDCWGQVPN